MHLDESAQVMRHVSLPIRLLDDPRGQACERGVPERTQGIVQPLVAQQRLERLAVVVNRVEMRAGIEQLDRQVRSAGGTE